MLAQTNLIIITGSVKHGRAQINKSTPYQDQSGMFKSWYQYVQHSNIQGNLVWNFFIFSLPWYWWYYWLCHIFSHALLLCRKLRVHHAFTILFHDIFLLFFKRNHVSDQGFFFKTNFRHLTTKKTKKKGWQIQQRDFWEFFLRIFFF